MQKLTDQEKKELLIRFTEAALVALIRVHYPADEAAIKSARIAYQAIREIEVIQEYKEWLITSQL
jgi:hypothetical protein